MKRLLKVVLVLSIIGSASAQDTTAPSKDPLPSCVANPKGVFTGYLEVRKIDSSLGGRVFYIVGRHDIIIFDLPVGAEAAEPAIASTLAEKGTVQLSWSGSYIERDPVANLKLEVYTGARLRLLTGEKSMSCLPAIDPMPMSQLAPKPKPSI